MAGKIITLTTDFGADSGYVAQMKAVLLTRSPHATLVDITHSVPPQNVRSGAVTLRDCCPYFPPGTVHLAVVDPGVGSSRAILAARIHDHLFVAPDNGLLGRLIREQGLQAAVAVDVAAFGETSSTFHGRDIMAPAAAMLRNDEDALDRLGKPIRDIVELPPARLERVEQGVDGEVEAVDHFGNLISNIPAEWLPSTADSWRFQCGSGGADTFASHYAERRPGELIGLIGSHGRAELAVVNGSAAAALQAGLGDPFQVRWS